MNYINFKFVNFGRHFYSYSASLNPQVPPAVSIINTKPNKT